MAGSFRKRPRPPAAPQLTRWGTTVGGGRAGMTRWMEPALWLSGRPQTRGDLALAPRAGSTETRKPLMQTSTSRRQPKVPATQAASQLGFATGECATGGGPQGPTPANSHLKPGWLAGHSSLGARHPRSSGDTRWLTRTASNQSSVAEHSRGLSQFYALSSFTVKLPSRPDARPPPYIPPPSGIVNSGAWLCPDPNSNWESSISRANVALLS